jgi:hypothetical protein
LTGKTTFQITRSYRSSPFFDFLKMILDPFEKKYLLLDLNFEALKIFVHCFRMKIDYKTTTEYHHGTAILTDFRALVNGKKLSSFEVTQVF